MVRVGWYKSSQRRSNILTAAIKFFCDMRYGVETWHGELLRHRQTKEPDSARPHLNRRATPRLHLKIPVNAIAIFHQLTYVSPCRHQVARSTEKSLSLLRADRAPRNGSQMPSPRSVDPGS